MHNSRIVAYDAVAQDASVRLREYDSHTAPSYSVSWHACVPLTLDRLVGLARPFLLRMALGYAAISQTPNHEATSRMTRYASVSLAALKDGGVHQFWADINFSDNEHRVMEHLKSSHWHLASVLSGTASATLVSVTTLSHLKRAGEVKIAKLPHAVFATHSVFLLDKNGRALASDTDTTHLNNARTTSIATHLNNARTTSIATLIRKQPRDGPETVPIGTVSLGPASTLYVFCGAPPPPRPLCVCACACVLGWFFGPRECMRNVCRYDQTALFSWLYTASCVFQGGVDLTPTGNTKPSLSFEALATLFHCGINRPRSKILC